jgi:branched-chain amino acid aminotransferase
MAEWVYLNGQLITAEEARISAFDAGFTHATGLFETLRSYSGRVFRLQDHLDRMRASATALDMHTISDVISDSRLPDAIADLLTANNLLDARLRIVATPGGVTKPGLDEATLRPTIFMVASPLQGYSADLYQSGMRVCIAPYRISRSDPLAGHKTLCYLPRLLAMRDAHLRKCHEALWFTTGNLLAEGIVSNVFVIHQGKLLTPAMDTPVLPGIIRKVINELSADQNIALEESRIDIDTLLSSSEVFLTSSIMEIMPVTAIEKHAVGSGAPGEITKTLMRELKKLVTRECVA